MVALLTDVSFCASKFLVSFDTLFRLKCPCAYPICLESVIRVCSPMLPLGVRSLAFLHVTYKPVIAYFY